MPTGKIIISDSLVESRMHGKVLTHPDSTWNHPNPDYKDKIILSPCNRKVNNGSNRLGLGDSLSYGKPAVISCAWLGSCYRICYARRVNARFKASLRIHGHNYKIIYGKDIKYILNAIESGYIQSLQRYPNLDIQVIRLNDSGDFISYNEILAWIEFSQLNPGLIIYGYTKASPFIYRALTEFKTFPDNFRMTLSRTDNLESTLYTNKCIAEFRNQVITCDIIESVPDTRPDLPWNDEERRAIIHDRDFKIALHDNSKIGNYYRQLAKDIGIHTC